jgi:hypothetical protein
LVDAKVALAVFVLLVLRIFPRIFSDVKFPSHTHHQIYIFQTSTISTCFNMEDSSRLKVVCIEYADTSNYYALQNCGCIVLPSLEARIISLRGPTRVDVLFRKTLPFAC